MGHEVQPCAQKEEEILDFGDCLWHVWCPIPLSRLEPDPIKQNIFAHIKKKKIRCTMSLALVWAKTYQENMCITRNEVIFHFSLWCSHLARLHNWLLLPSSRPPSSSSNILTSDLSLNALFHLSIKTYFQLGLCNSVVYPFSKTRPFTLRDAMASGTVLHQSLQSAAD